MRSHRMALTPKHVAQVHRVLEDPGPDPTWTYHTDEDYDALVRGLLASHPGGPDTWLFAYGSLIWKPELDHVEVRRGTARGWHRSFCLPDGLLGRDAVHISRTDHVLPFCSVARLALSRRIPRDRRRGGAGSFRLLAHIGPTCLEGSVRH
jgi:ChaC-like protein